MFYYLFDFLQNKLHLNIPGGGLFQFISFRSVAAMVVSLIISLIYGKKVINYLLKKQVGETVRDLGLDGQKQKQGTPTMGGILIIGCILIPTLLFAKIDNIYVIQMYYLIQISSKIHYYLNKSWSSIAYYSYFKFGCSRLIMFSGYTKRLMFLLLSM